MRSESCCCHGNSRASADFPVLARMDMHPHCKRWNVLLWRLASRLLCQELEWMVSLFGSLHVSRLTAKWQPVNKSFILIHLRSSPRKIQAVASRCWTAAVATLVAWSVAPRKMANVTAIKLRTCLWWCCSAFPQSRWCHWMCGDFSLSAVSPHSPVLISPLDYRVHDQNHITFL